MKETIRRIRKRKTWVNPTSWGLNKEKWLGLTILLYLLSLIALLRGEIKISFIPLIMAIVMTLIYIKIRRQLKNRFKDIEDKFRNKDREG